MAADNYLTRANNCGSSLDLPTCTQPDGLCKCGCGKKTPIFKGQPLQYLQASHNPNFKKRQKVKRPGAEPRAKLAKIKAPDLPIAKAPINPEEKGRFSRIIAWTAVNQDFLLEQRRLHEAHQRETDRLYQEKRRKSDIEFRLLGTLRSRIYTALKGAGKSRRTVELVGCDIKALRRHLEAQFQTGMSWDNYGLWHVDHIMPCCSFNLAVPEEQKKCFHYTNLQPLWAEDNFRKNGRRNHNVLISENADS
jgi:hypothetical protein